MPVEAGAQAIDPNPLLPGKLRQVVTYLEMCAPPTPPPAPPTLPPSAGECALGSPVRLSPGEYRALYRRVGERWLWWERLTLNDAALAAILDDPLVEIRLFRVGGEVAGYSEIDRRANAAAVDLAFLGLAPEFTGRGLGRLLLEATLRAAWRDDARRVWLHTCDHDHPRALELYQSAGFTVVRREQALIDDPRLNGLLPLDAAPHVPLAAHAGRRSAS